MKEETKSLYIALFASILIIFGVNHFFPAEKSEIKNKKPEEVIEII